MSSPGSGSVDTVDTLPQQMEPGATVFVIDLNTTAHKSPTNGLVLGPPRDIYIPAVASISANGQIASLALQGDKPLLLVRLVVSYLTGATNDGTHLWTVAANEILADGSSVQMASFDTSANATATAIAKVIAAFNNTLLLAGSLAVTLTGTKTSTPSALTIYGVTLRVQDVLSLA